MSIGNAAYWLVMFQIDPVPLGAPGPILLKVTRADYERASTDIRATVICKKGKFIINNKRIFWNEMENSIYLIADVEKILE
jgi:hypothetical protein